MTPYSRPDFSALKRASYLTPAAMSTIHHHPLPPYFHLKVLRHLETKKSNGHNKSAPATLVVGPPPNAPFRFLQLPPEIRNKVYRELLDSAVPDHPKLGKWCKPRCLHPAIIFTCHQIYNEASGLLQGGELVLLYSSGVIPLVPGQLSPEYGVKALLNGQEVFKAEEVIRILQ
ncbi:uncharacterized protein LTR77_008991 [Saxophila tyrrhenica]|uniref:Uncharacterized protein n=1 Tax=Saxophila tyrrhenica TaxID=1690608 RepID=A0AAV9P032_9PEZI|nr:hypothetical protein LTR77_008991 [Saxophila tyrrhenica]